MPVSAWFFPRPPPPSFLHTEVPQHSYSGMQSTTSESSFHWVQKWSHKLFHPLPDFQVHFSLWCLWMPGSQVPGLMFLLLQWAQVAYFLSSLNNRQTHIHKAKQHLSLLLLTKQHLWIVFNGRWILTTHPSFCYVAKNLLADCVMPERSI